MKNKIITIVLFTLAFITVNAQIKKSSKITIPKDKGFQKLEVKQKVDKDAILESDLFAFYNRSELLKLDAKKKNLRKKITQGDKNAEVQLNKLGAKKNIVQINLNQAVANSVNALRYYQVFKDFPKPPCPPEKECAIGALKELVIANNIKSIKVIAYDKNGKKVAYLEKTPFLIDKKSGLIVYRFKMIKKYSGPILLKVNSVSKSNTVENYQIALTLL